MTTPLPIFDDQRRLLVRRGLWLELVTLGWNVVGCVVLLIAALSVRSVGLAGFGIDSLIEIVASTVVIWHLNGITDRHRERRALQSIAIAFVVLALYLAVQAIVVLARGIHPGHSTTGIAWLATTVVVMLGLAHGKRDTGAKLANAVLLTEGRVTLIDALLALAVLVGTGLNALVDWWWADPASAFVLVGYASREGRLAWREAGRGEPDVQALG